jgi:hypothetical protein
MTSYFDIMSGRVHDAAARSAGDDFLAELEAIEAEVIADVTRNTDDREFPPDLRERILTIIATQGVKSPTEGRRLATIGRYSPMIEALHSLYHDLARHRIPVRNGAFAWTDDPTVNNRLRDGIDGETK